ncbi:hypothetical protein AB6A40_003290 [Gnathostoma spinigerum]|uniref:Snurportin-1 n=1 Tax=Gnathostoma spinigerum TaxID=75299 RepID=A0ABD6EAD8_9BILA
MADDSVDHLSVMLEGSMWSEPCSTDAQHPRYSQYKNANRQEKSQEKRRLDYLEHQKNARFDYVNHARKLAMNEFDASDDDEAVCKMESDDGMGEIMGKKHKSQRHRYADELMLSEWLVDIPEELSTDWICVLCPVGKRCLVVASRGVTSSYSKSGYLMKQFSSFLPGGNRSSKGHYTLLDCIFVLSTKTFFCLDIIAWNDVSCAENEFDCRLFLLNSRISENENFRESSKQFPFRFVCLPYCRSSKEDMEELVRIPVDFQLDGILFYHSKVRYQRGRCPLVGWLKPWMLPEILSVSVPSELMDGHASDLGNSQKFIDEFNAKYHHIPPQKSVVDDIKLLRQDE